MSYKKEHYQQVFQAISERYSIEYPPYGFYPAAMSLVKRMFDDDLTIQNIVAALPEAQEKRKWPVGTGFLKRLHQVALKNRREYNPFKIYDGVKSLGSLLAKRNV